MKPVVVLSVPAVALLAGCSSMPGSASKKAEEHTAHWSPDMELADHEPPPVWLPHFSKDTRARPVNSH